MALAPNPKAKLAAHTADVGAILADWSEVEVNHVGHLVQIGGYYQGVHHAGAREDHVSLARDLDAAAKREAQAAADAAKAAEVAKKEIEDAALPPLAPTVADAGGLPAVAVGPADAAPTPLEPGDLGGSNGGGIAEHNTDVLSKLSDTTPAAPLTSPDLPAETGRLIPEDLDTPLVAADPNYVPPELEPFREADESVADFRGRAKKLLQRFGMDEKDMVPGSDLAPLTKQEKMDLLPMLAAIQAAGWWLTLGAAPKT